jgi:hypothetical protein
MQETDEFYLRVLIRCRGKPIFFIGVILSICKHSSILFNLRSDKEFCTEVTGRLVFLGFRDDIPEYYFFPSFEQGLLLLCMHRGIVLSFSPAMEKETTVCK